jgi:hypothetical protein
LWRNRLPRQPYAERRAWRWLIVDADAGHGVNTRPNGAGNQTPLEKTVKAFRDNLALKDNGAIYVTLGTVAGNLLASRDPVWLGLIGPPSTAKTELLNALNPLSYVHVVETFTPAGLLSGTPKKGQGERRYRRRAAQDRRFWDHGVQGLRQRDRTAPRAASRDDGGAAPHLRWSIYEGGVTLSWHGKAGCIFGATQAYDAHHAVSGSLGYRFLLYRIESMPDDQLVMCQLRNGKTMDMRQTLANAVADLFASLPNPLPDPEVMNNDEYAALSSVILKVIRLRAGVMRDGYRHEIIDVVDPEGPARLALALQHLFAGLHLIGVDRYKSRRHRRADRL